MSTDLTKQALPAEAARELIWPEWVYPYPAGAVGGFLGGVAVAIVGASYGLISGIGPWLPVNVVAATLMRGMQEYSPAVLRQFDPMALVVGLLLHMGMSVGLGVMFSFILPALPGRPLYWGPVIGPLLWVGASIAALPILNPVMAQNVEWISFALANVAYGLVLGLWIDRTPMIHQDH